MTVSLEDLDRLYAFMRVQARPPVRIIAGPVAWVRLVRSLGKLLAPAVALSPDMRGLTLYGLPVIEDQTRHPDYLAVEYADGNRLPVAEV